MRFAWGRVALSFSARLAAVLWLSDTVPYSDFLLYHAAGVDAPPPAMPQEEVPVQPAGPVGSVPAVRAGEALGADAVGEVRPAALAREDPRPLGLLRAVHPR